MASVAQLRQLQLLLWVVLLTVCGGLLADKRACGRVGAAHRAGRVVPHRNNTLSVCCGINARDRSRFTSDSSWNSCGSRGRGSGTNSAGAPGDVRQFMSSTGEVGKRYGPNNFGKLELTIGLQLLVATSQLRLGVGLLIVLSLGIEISRGCPDLVEIVPHESEHNKMSTFDPLRRTEVIVF